MKPTTMAEEERASKVARAMLAGPPHITETAAIMDDKLDLDGNPILLRGPLDLENNKCVLMPGNENKIGSAHMCADPHGMEWAMSVMMGLPYPTNKEPGFIYMLCGATQHSNENALDKKTSPGIPIGPHWMICWPYDNDDPKKQYTSARIGLPSDVRDVGAWQMFDGRPYAVTHICGNPWAGNKYYPTRTKPVWTMEYQPST